MIVLSLVRRGAVARGSFRCQYRNFSTGLARRNAHALTQEAHLQNIRNIGIIAHVDAVSRLISPLRLLLSIL